MNGVETITSSIALVVPETFLLLAGCALIGIGAFLSGPRPGEESKNRNRWGWTMLGLLVVTAGIGLLRGDSSEPMARGLFRFDETSRACEQLTLLGGVLLVLMGWSNAPARALPEYYGSLAILLSGLAFVGSANDLTTLFLALELVSIPTYVLLSVCRRDVNGREAMLKYFTLSSFSSCIFLLGLSYLYGIAGSTDLESIARALTQHSSSLVTVALTLVLCGLAFRATVVPFHFYASDVFAGTSLTMAALLSYLPKIAGFVAILRIAGGVSLEAGAPTLSMTPVLLLAGLTMTVGNALALVQTNWRRLLAYSSVAHSGYLLVGVAGVLSANVSPEVVYGYLAVYGAMTLGAFAITIGLQSRPRPMERIEDLRGLVTRSPLAAFGLLICLISLIGLPLTGGFWAKLGIFLSAIATDVPSMRVLAVLMALNAAIAAAYYLRVAAVLFSQGDAGPVDRAWHPAVASASIACCGLTVLWFFVPS